MQRDSGASSLVSEGASPAGRCEAVDAVWVLCLVKTAWSPGGSEVLDDFPWLSMLALNLESLWVGVTGGGVGGASGADLASWFLERTFVALMCVLLD